MNEEYETDHEPEGDDPLAGIDEATLRSHPLFQRMEQDLKAVKDKTSQTGQTYAQALASRGLALDDEGELIIADDSVWSNVVNQYQQQNGGAGAVGRAGATPEDLEISEFDSPAEVARKVEARLTAQFQRFQGETVRQYEARIAELETLVSDNVLTTGPGLKVAAETLADLDCEDDIDDPAFLVHFQTAMRTLTPAQRKNAASLELAALAAHRTLVKERKAAGKPARSNGGSGGNRAAGSADHRPAGIAAAARAGLAAVTPSRGNRTGGAEPHDPLEAQVQAMAQANPHIPERELRLMIRGKMGDGQAQAEYWKLVEQRKRGKG